MRDEHLADLGDELRADACRELTHALDDLDGLIDHAHALRAEAHDALTQLHQLHGWPHPQCRDEARARLHRAATAAQRLADQLHTDADTLAP